MSATTTTTRARALMALASRVTVTDTDTARATALAGAVSGADVTRAARVATAPAMLMALATVLDPSSAAYELTIARATGVRVAPEHYQGGRVTGTRGYESEISASPDDVRDLTDDGAATWGRWHGTVPTGREPRPVSVLDPIRTHLDLAADERVAMPAEHRAILAALADGTGATKAGRPVLARLGAAIGATGTAPTVRATARDTLTAALAPVTAAIARHLADTARERPATRYVVPVVYRGRVVGGRIASRPGPAVPPVTGVSLTYNPRAARERMATAPYRVRRPAPVTPADGPVTVTRTAPRAARTVTAPAPTLTGRDRYRVRVLGVNLDTARPCRTCSQIIATDEWRDTFPGVRLTGAHALIPSGWRACETCWGGTARRARSARATAPDTATATAAAGILAMMRAER